MTWLLLSAAPAAQTVPSSQALYAREGIRPESVRQGALGSCYFHSVIAALAQAKPDQLQKMIHANDDGTWVVQFGDEGKENVYPEDVQYSRSSGYDLSDGVWVAVLFRAFAQRVLRSVLIQAVDKSEYLPFVKDYAKQFISTNDTVLLAYDRAIRTQVDPVGNLDREKLEAKLKAQMSGLEISDQIKDSLVGLLDSGGFFDAVANSIKENGEIFGAYRAVGQGGVAGQVMAAFGGDAVEVANENDEEAAGVLARGSSEHRPLVACTGGSQFYKHLAAHESIPFEAKSWYVNSHCFTVLAYDSGARTVTLRNPWGQGGGPGGVFSIAMPMFLPAFRGIVTTGK